MPAPGVEVDFYNLERKVAEPECRQIIDRSIEIVRKIAERTGHKMKAQIWGPPYPFKLYGIPGVKNIAVLLGFERPASEEEEMYVPRSEFDRLQLYKHYITDKLHPLPLEKWKAFFYEFAALYSDNWHSLILPNLISQ